MFKNLSKLSKVILMVALSVFTISVISLISVYTKDIQSNKTYMCEQNTTNFEYELTFFDCGLFTKKYEKSGIVEHFTFYIDEDNIRSKEIDSNSFSYFGKVKNPYTIEVKAYNGDIYTFICENVQTQVMLSWLGSIVSAVAVASIIIYNKVVGKKNTQVEDETNN